MTAAELTAALDRAEAAGCFGPGSPPDAGDVAAVLSVGPAPAELRALYLRANGLVFRALEVFDLGDWEAVNEDESLFDLLPGTAFFGTDQRDGYFLLDPGDTLGGGRGAAWWADRGVLAPDGCRFAAADLAAFIDKALAGEGMRDGPELGQRSLDRLAEAIAAHPDAVVAHPGYGEPEALLAARDRGLPVPFSLVDFYERFDGLYLKEMRLEVFALAQLAPVEETVEGAAAGALWFGRDVGGRRYAVACGGWRGLAEGQLLSVAAGEDIRTAASLGRFSDVLRVWIGRGA